MRRRTLLLGLGSLLTACHPALWATAGAPDQGEAPGQAVAAPPGDSTAPPAASDPALVFAAQMPQVTSAGGAVIADPKAVIISFTGDPLASSVEAFAAALGGSSYWTTTTSEYGVGPLVVRPPVHLARSAPSSLSDAALRTLLTEALANRANAFGPPDPSTIYTVLVPSGTTDTGPGGQTACGASFASYHSSIALDDGTVIPYAVIVECPATAGLSRTLSHALAEAATDPYAPGTPAFRSVGPHDLGYRVGDGARGSEVGDMCEQAAVATLPDLTQKVARVWSNAAARSGHNPCLPVPQGEAFFMTLPSSVPDSIRAALPNGSGDPPLEGSGFALARGQSRTIELGLIGEGTTEAWTVAVREVAPPESDGPEPAPRLTFALDKTTGKVGDRISLTLTAIGDTEGGVPFAVDSVLNGTTRTWYGVAGLP